MTEVSECSTDFHGNYDEIDRQVFVECMNLRKYDKILDVACGRNLFKSILGDNIIGLDICSKEADVKGDLYNIPFENCSFDCVLARNIFEHLDMPLKATTEMKRVLKKGGCLIAIAPSKYHKNFWDGYGHVHPYNPNTFKYLFHDAGFKRSECYYSSKGFKGITLLKKISIIVRILKVLKVIGYKNKWFSVGIGWK